MREFIDFAAHKLPLPECSTRRERIEHSQQMLLRALGLGTTVAVIGSGMTIPFGYPTWQELATEILEFTLHSLEETSRSAQDQRFTVDVEEVKRMLAGAKAQEQDQNALMFLIGSCKKLLLRNHLKKDYDEIFRKRFGQGTWVPWSAFGPLLDLPIKRFVTTNYDCEIERALIRKWKLPPEEFGLGNDLRGQNPASRSSPRSFTQRAESLHHLAHFALAGVSDNDNRVFHCHGRFDDPETIIATEADYQLWYLGKQEGASLAFQQSFELLLGSNPLLFLGYGLRDEDLLRPLRELVALDSKQKGSRPIFALLPEEEGNDPFHHDALFDRYGLHVIPYPSLGKRTDQRTEALCRKLRHLKTLWRKARRSQPRKPLLRKLLPDKVLPNLLRDIHPDPQVKPVLLAHAEALLAPGITVLIGPTGSAKTALAMDLQQIAVEGRDRLEKFHRAFYWNAHYANETLTGIDYALEYLDPKGRGSHCDRIRRCLRDHRYLIVIDGCERLLRKGDSAGSGLAYSVNFRRLLHAFADPQSRSTVLLAGRKWLSDLDSYLEPGPLPGSMGHRSERPTVRRVEVTRMTSGTSLPPFPFPYPVEDPEVAALFSLLEGHQYGLDLASRYLREAPKARLSELNRRLAEHRRDERLRAMFRIVLESLDDDQWKGLASDFLERLSLFLNPICEETLVLCYTQAREEQCRRRTLRVPELAPKERREKALELCRAMVTSGLLLGVRPFGEEEGEKGHTVHVTARRLLFQPNHGLDHDPLPAVGLSGFTAGRTGVPPDHDRCHAIRSLIESLLRDAESASCPRLCRDAFGLLRTRMEANTVPRWTTYNDYLPFGIRVAQLAKRVSGSSWMYCEPLHARCHIEHLEAPLYAAELAWLYNDLALALSAEGSIHDACGLWEHAFEVSRLLESPEGGAFQLELLLSLTFSSIEMGRLPAARSYLEEADRILLTESDDDAQARILGLRGLMAHLGGDLQAADDFYERCLHLLQSGTNLRAQSIFLKHRADIKITTGQCEQADLLIRNSRALAEAGVFPELIANARISEGHRLFRRGDAVKARLEYNAVLKEAQRIGVRKLETRALTALARLALDQKDADSAHDYALHSLRLANEMGLGIRQTHSLVVLGLATLAIDERDFGIALLRQAKKLADSQEYWARSREAENKLQELNVDPDGTEYPAKTMMLGRG